MIIGLLDILFYEVPVHIFYTTYIALSAFSLDL